MEAGGKNETKKERKKIRNLEYKGNCAMCGAMG
jgi:hypothetical protein